MRNLKRIVGAFDKSITKKSPRNWCLGEGLLPVFLPAEIRPSTFKGQNVIVVVSQPCLAVLHERYVKKTCVNFTHVYRWSNIHTAKHKNIVKHFL